MGVRDLIVGWALNGCRMSAERDVRRCIGHAGTHIGPPISV